MNSAYDNDDVQQSHEEADDTGGFLSDILCECNNNALILPPTLLGYLDSLNQCHDLGGPSLPSPFYSSQCSDSGTASPSDHRSRLGSWQFM